MTVGQKLHQTLNDLQSVTTSMKNFALDTQNEEAKQEFSNYAQQLENIVQGLKNRVNFTEQQEPQYKQYQQEQKH